MIDKFDVKIITKYLTGIESDTFHRYKSWEYCYKAFSENKQTENYELQLAFYLASWGMYRGSCGLLQKNHLVHEGAIKILFAEKYRPLRCSPTVEVTIKSVPLILELKKEIKQYYENIFFTRGTVTKLISGTDTLISKILLGSLACVPAYDRYFILGLADQGIKQSVFNKNSLNELFDFIKSNQNEILECQKRVRKEAQAHYPLMKIIDMYFWQKGYDREVNK